MATTMDDVIRDMAADEWYRSQEQEHFEGLSKLFHAVYLFVEGESEKRALPILFELANYDHEADSIIICNCGGATQFINALRLLRNTLSSDRPVVILLDNDQEGKDVFNELKALNFYNLLIPQDRDGEFEEIFSEDNFLKACLEDIIARKKTEKQKKKFEQHFDRTQPWSKQFYQFLGLTKKQFAPNKPKIAEKMAIDCTSVPSDILNLIEVLKKVREKYPISNIADFNTRPFPG